ncbi:MAG: hypothetical protein ABI592_09895 [Acidobacteriota bacterium]
MKRTTLSRFAAALLFAAAAPFLPAGPGTPTPLPAAPAAAAVATPAVPTPQPPASREAESVDAIVRSLYEAVSHPPNQEPDWSRMRAIFLPAGRLIPPRRPTGELAMLTPEDFIARVSAGIATRKSQGGKDQGFSEREISRKTDCYGNICQVFSTYEGRYTAADAAPFVRGINALQLVKEGNRWWVVEVLWDQESADKPIPPEYLGKKP